MIFVDLILILLFSFLLAKATDIVVGAINRLSETTNLGKFGLTAFLVALSTSLPELFVGITAAMTGQPELSLGNVIGSNIANLSLVIGGAALIGGTVGVVGEFLKKDFFTAFLVAALPLMLFMDGSLSAVDGAALLVVYAIYNLTTLWKKPEYQSRKKMGVPVRLLSRFRDLNTDKQLFWIVIGSALMIVASDFLVKLAVEVAMVLSLPTFLVGLFLVAVGTSLPELSFEIGAIRRRETGMVYGNLLGSIVANSTLVLGVTSLLGPIKLGGESSEYLLATLAFIVIFGVFWIMVRTKKKLERWEGALLLAVYGLFLVLEFWFKNGN